MPSEVSSAEPFHRPRPRVVKTLGVINITVAVLIIACNLASSCWVYLASLAEVRVVATVSPSSGMTGVGSEGRSIGLFGMDDPGFIRLVIVDSATGLIVNGLMLASGIGLVNLRTWGARWWAWTAWAKIVRLGLIWGTFIVAVAPGFTLRMAGYLLATVPFRTPTRGGPRLDQLTRVLAVMSLIAAVAMIVLGSLYPAISLWILGRPDVRAALGDPDRPEERPK